jgi:hypothetical protein
MALNLHPALRALIAIVIDGGIGMHRRLEAAEAIMEYPAPEPVANACRRFLLETAESQTNTPAFASPLPRRC